MFSRFGPFAIFMCLAMPAEARSNDVGELVGTWTGKYICLQGVTGLDLTFQKAGEGVVSGRFAFYAIPENPNVPSGLFEVSARQKGDFISVTAGRWIDRPSGYHAVDLLGKLSDDGSVFSGEVFEGCKTFHLSRYGAPGTDAAPPTFSAPPEMPYVINVTTKN